MKRAGNLFENVVSWSNLLAAFRRAMQGCGRIRPTCRFFFELEHELLALQAELCDGTYRPGAYRYFKVYDPKERTIAVAPFRDRVVHHAVVNVLLPIYEKVFIYDSYATRPAKGTHMAICRAQKYVNHRDTEDTEKSSKFSRSEQKTSVPSLRGRAPLGRRQCLERAQRVGGKKKHSRGLLLTCMGTGPEQAGPTG